jgi:HNH endonuclease
VRLARRKPRLTVVGPVMDWQAITDALLLRSDGYCESCGLSLPSDPGQWDRHHRQSRRFGDNSLSNLVALHSQCHVVSPWSVHQRVTWAKEMGLIVPSWMRPSSAALWLPDERLVYLTDDGHYRVIEEES